jgi:hypothetical protein
LRNERPESPEKFRLPDSTGTVDEEQEACVGLTRIPLHLTKNAEEALLLFVSCEKVVRHGTSTMYARIDQHSLAFPP